MGTLIQQLTMAGLRGAAKNILQQVLIAVRSAFAATQASTSFDEIAATWEMSGAAMSLQLSCSLLSLARTMGCVGAGTDLYHGRDL